jgi:hypothetical protein
MKTNVPRRKDKDCTVDGNDGAIGFIKTQDGRSLVPVTEGSTIRHMPDMERKQTPGDLGGRCYPADPTGRMLHFVVLFGGTLVFGAPSREVLACYDTLDEAMTLIDRLAHWLDKPGGPRVFDVQHASEHLKNKATGDSGWHITSAADDIKIDGINYRLCRLYNDGRYVYIPDTKDLADVVRKQIRQASTEEIADEVWEKIKDRQATAAQLGGMRR